MDKKKSFIIFFSLLLVCFVFFLYGNISSAADQVLTKQEFDKKIADIYDLDSFSWGPNWESFLNYWSQNDDYSVIFDRNQNNGVVVAEIGSSTIFSETDYNYVISGRVSSEYASNGNTYGATFISRSYDKTHPIYYLDYNTFVNGNIDFENLIYAVNIPIPELDVTYVPAISMLGGLPQTNNVFTDIIVEDNAAFKIQLAVKVTVADMVQIGLTNGTTTYKYLDWTEGNLSDIYSLEDLQDAENISISNSDLSTVWDSLYNSLYDDSDFPVFSSSVPFWNSNPNAQKYLDAQSYYRNNMARQMPMYGTRLEVFARYFAIDDNKVYVGAWRHWNSAEPLNTEKITDKYQDQQPFPGTENTNTNVDYDTYDDTYTTIGNQTGVYTDPYTQVVINQNVPNYPDYPTAVSYNHDNILLQFIETANDLPKFFGQFGAFLTDTFSFIDKSVWAIIELGFMCSIVVMIVKIL